MDKKKFYTSQKMRWKLMLFLAAIVIGFSSLLYTNKLVKKLSVEERKKVALWAEATKQLAKAGTNEDIGFILKILQTNETVPTILADEDDKIISYRNLDTAKVQKTDYLKKQLKIMKEQNPPIIITISDQKLNYIYYKDSVLMTKLSYYPFIQLGVIFLFIGVSYLAFSVSRKAEQNQVWVGMSKETAHQLGTPISSLLAWLEIMKETEPQNKMIDEVEKDIKRLETITERFSKIGSAPKLILDDIIKVINHSISYIKNRSSNKINFILDFNQNHELLVPLNIPLFEWVIENLCKNAIDAMSGSGTISIKISDHVQVVYIDLNDTGKGIPKSKYKTVFNPGYTTKKRGWGLGLSLAKRIVEVYHSGKIFIKNSEINKGTTFRIVLKK